ncbi:hypothetical protein HZC21_03080 [Candidatus Peregrinibacteria bacterium]|nr:hypothetical protein [Candidatus Peregrinibacteria bacterium]
MGRFVKIVVYAPASHANKVRKALAEAGCGYIGKYDFCSFSVKGIGRFRPKPGAKPFIGKTGKIEKVTEERIETICPKTKLKKTLAALKKAHPYEEPAIDIYPVLNKG